MDEQEWTMTLEGVKMNVLQAIKHSKPFICQYSIERDLLLLLFTEPTCSIPLYYVDDRISLIIDPETREVIGLHIENFERQVVPNDEELDVLWGLEGEPLLFKSTEELLITLDRLERKLTKILFRLTGTLLKSHHKALSRAFLSG